MQSAFCLMRKPADARGLQHQRGRGVDPCLQLAVEHIQPLAVTAEQLHLGDEVGGVLLLLALLLNEPVQHLHGAEVPDLVRGGVDGIDAGGDKPLMLQRLFQRRHVCLLYTSPSPRDRG